ncbi:MAG: Bicyclomycin resistance protein [Paracidovorax wautersii]|uniref:Bcr/CflA family efflux transporter n=1 Tax=Paracidovorax wautersii TaxID=1177982 RepID=A0A7V8JR51_9BURK|nr:MAG: Bicyclomycin resistance protein [Paracidovorax wautersii]
MTHASLTVVLAMLAMVGALGIDTYLPAFHAIGADFQVGPLVVQQTLSVYVACMSLTMLVSGTLSDSFGRRRVLVVALVGYTLTSLAAAAAPNVQALIVLRALQGLSAGAGLVVGRAMVQDLFKGAEAQRVMATITMVFSLAPAIAPIPGGVLQSLAGWRSIFIFMALYGAVLWVICQRGLPETLPAAQRAPFHPGPILARYAESLRHPGFVLMIVAIALIFGGLPLYIGSAAALIIDILGLTETDFGWLFIPLVTGTVGGAWLGRHLARRVAPQRILNAGMSVMLLATIASVVYASAWQVRLPYVVLPLLVFTFGMVLAMPVMVLRALSVFPHMRGLAASMQSFVQMMAFALIAGFVSPLVFHSARSIAITHLAFLLLGMLLWRAAMRTLPPAAPRAGGTPPAPGTAPHTQA